MNFLTPLYLAALAGISIPLILHLIRRQTRDNQMFSSLMFLSPSPPRVNRRSRIDNWPLLLMRAAILALFAFAFARPFLAASADTPLNTATRLRILLLDRSASMSRDDLWPQALQLASDAVNDLSPRDSITIIAYDQNADIVLDTVASQDASDNTQKAIAVLEDLKKRGTTWLSTQHSDALQTAVDQFERYRSSAAWIPNTLCEVVLISDMQAGEEFERLRAMDWPKDLVLVVKPVTSTKTSNATATLLGRIDDFDNSDDVEKLKPVQAAGAAALARRYRVRIDNSASSTKTAFTLEWVDSKSTANERVAGSFDVPAGQSRVIQINGPSFENGSLTLIGDDIGFDNQFYFHQPKPRQSTILYLSDRKITDDGQELGYFLQKISTGSTADLPQVQIVSTQSLAESLKTLTPPSLIIANSDIRADTSESLKQHVEQGGTLLMVVDRIPGQIEELNHWWRQMFADATVTISESQVKDFLLWQNIDFRSSIFAPFNDSKSNNFAKIHFWKSRALDVSDDDQWHRLVTYDSGEPALLQRTVGKGRVYVMASGWQVTDSQLALSTKFVPILLNMIAAAATPQHRMAWTVGQSIDPAELQNIDSVQTPEGQKLPTADAGWTASLPGLYQCLMKDGTQQIAAANLVRSECQTEPLTADQFEQFGINLDRMSDRVALEQNARQMRNTELEASQQWWRWLLVCGLVLVGLETVFSARYRTA